MTYSVEYKKNDGLWHVWKSGIARLEDAKLAAEEFKVRFGFRAKIRQSITFGKQQGSD